MRYIMWKLKLKIGLISIMSMFLILLALFLTTDLQAQSPRDAYEIRELNVDGITKLDVRTAGGFIRVEGKRGSTAEVQVYVRRRGEYFKKGEIDLDEWSIDIEQNGDEIRVVADREGSWNWNSRTPNVSFVVILPPETVSELRTSGGSITMKNLEGNQVARTSGGSINVENITGNTEVKTSGGAIDVKDVSGNVNAGTSGGTITIASIDGNVEARTSGGGIDLSDISGNVNGRTSGGGIRAELSQLAEFVDLSTSGGSIRIKVPEGSGLDLNLRGNSVRTDLQNFSGSSKRNKVEGTVNGGGTRIEARTSGGSVRLEYN